MDGYIQYRISTVFSRVHSIENGNIFKEDTQTLGCIKNRTMRIILIIGILLFINISCFSQEIKKKEISFEVNSTIEINDCIIWHVDFSELKSTVLYKSHFISMGLYGGFVAIDTSLTHVNRQYSKKLNSDLYTNLAVRHDTLFAEKFNKIYYLSDKDTSWISYQLNEPIALFDILFEDEKYVFFSISQGEFGTILFIYDKEIRKLRVASYGDDPKCIYYQDTAYYINASLRHGGGSSSYKSLQNIGKLNIISEDKNSNNPLFSLKSHFRRLPVTEYPDINFDPSVAKGILKSVLPIEYGIMVNNSFTIDNKYYHFTDFNGFSQSLSYDKTYITEVVDKEIKILDTIEPFRVLRTRKYNIFTIMESYFLDDGYYMSNNDSLYHIKFTELPANNSESNYNTDQSKICEETLIWKPNFKRKFSCELDSNLTINSFGSNDYRELYFQEGNNKRRILLNSKWNVLNKAFKNKDNWNLNFKNLGNVDHKYGLIEVYDLERFINEYSEK